MSTKKMHPPAVIHPTTGQTGGKGSLLPVACGKTTAKDRQNVENIVPSQNGTLSSAAGGGGGAEPQPNVPQNPLAAGKKAAPIATKTAVAPAVNPATAVQSRRKNHRHSNMSPSRKRQEQQSIFNNLRAWNVNIVTSGGGGVAPQEKRPAPVTSSNEAKAAAPVTTQTDKSSSTVVNGTATSSSSSSNTSSSSSISNVTSSNSISGSVKAKKQQSQLMAAVTVPVAVAATVKVEQQKKVEVGVATEHQAVTACKKDAAPSSVGSSTACEAAAAGKADGKTAGTGSKTAGAVAATAIKEERKLLNGGANGFGGRQSLAIPPPPPPSSLTAPPSSLSASAVGSGSSLLHPSSSSSIPVVSSTGSCSSSKHNSRASNAGKVLLPNVNPLDQFAVLQGKLRNSMSAPPPPAQQSHHNIPHHSHSSVAHNHQQQSQQQQQQQQSIPSTTTTSPQYSLDFLHYVGMRMSGSGGTTPQSTATAAAQAAALFRGNPHFNYSNFNQQLHPQQPSQQQQQQHHLQRHFSGYYEEMMVPAGGTGGGDAGQLYNGAAGYPGVDHLVNGAAAAVGNGGAGDSMAYCYSQNHQHNHHAHQHQHNHPPHQQQQQQQPTSGYGNGGFHQNNNYQQHNRNYGGGRGGQSNGGNMQGRKTWNNNNNSWHGKRSNMMQGGKFGGVGGIKGPNMSHGGYRKSYHYYNNNNNNHHHHHTNGHHHDPHQQQHQDQMRNLVYIRGYDRGQGAASSSQESTSRSPTPSPQSESPAIDTASEAVKTTSSNIAGSSGSSVQDEKSDSGIEDGAATLKKSGAVPSSSSSSSSVVSIPSTDSSAISSAASQNLSLELNGATGQGYESDSSHSSSYNSHTYRHRKYANGGQVYRSSSSTSSGVSSTATFPPLVVDFAMQTSSASAVNTPTASATSQQVADFFLRSQSYHGSHQNLTTVSGSASPNPPDSPVGAARPLVGTQSMPMFSELFTGQQHHNHHQQQNQQRTHPNSSYGSNSSLDSTLQNVVGGTPASASASSNNSNCSIVSTTSSSGYGSAPASTVPPNEAYSMQSGHPRRRFSGRSSPAPYTEQSHKPNRSSFGGSNTAVNSSSQQPPSPPSHNRKGQQPAWSTHRPVTVPTSATTTTTTTAIPPAPQVPPPSTSVPPPSNNLPLLHPIDGTNYHTPADRFLARSHLVELLAPPEDLAPAGSKWAALSSAVWDKFAATQQTQHKFVQKIQLWRYLFMCIRKAFPRFSLYLVGSTISGFASDNSDVDMCLVCRANTIPFDMRGEALFQLGQLKNYFMNINTYFEEFSVIQAKVPILRFRDSTNCIVVDLNYNNCVGIRNTHLLYCYSQLDWRLRPLTLVVKLWAQHHNINDAKNMTISSYSLVLMVIHFLQYGVSPPILPCLHAMYPDKFVRMSDISNLDLTETMEPYKNENAQSLGELFMQFLEYYANFDYTQYAISVRTASVIPIESARVARSYKNDPHHWRQLCIEEPFDLTNTARSVFDADIFEQIKSVFSTSWRRLKDTNDLGSIFECDPLFVPVASTLSITS